MIPDKGWRVIRLFGWIWMVLLPCSCVHPLKNDFHSRWRNKTQQEWIGPEYWSYRHDDWRIHQNRLECLNDTSRHVTVYLLTRDISSRQGTFDMSVAVGPTKGFCPSPDHYAGYLIGAGSGESDIQKRLATFMSSGEEGGLIIAVNGSGQLIVLDNGNNRTELARDTMSRTRWDLAGRVQLKLHIAPKRDGYVLDARAILPKGRVLSGITMSIPADCLVGSIALISGNGEANRPSIRKNKAGKHKTTTWWFRDWHLSGDKLDIQAPSFISPQK